MKARPALALVATPVLIALAACSDDGQDPPVADTTPATVTGQSGAPDLQVEVMMDGLEIPWDVAALPDGTMLVTERPGRLWAFDGEPRQIEADLADVFAQSEGGLMGVAVAPDFAESREFFLCLAHQEDGDPVDVRVTRWRLDEKATAAERTGVVIDGLPVSSGRHSGCRLIFAPDGTLHVGTGDAAQGGNPQDLTSLGGKTLRLHPDGSVPEDNPYAAEGLPQAAIYTSGHRNVQGLAVQPGSEAIWSAEHGPDVDDEVNILAAGGNYGWDPGAGGYDESVPMTDLEKFPDAVEAVWSSGDPTIATSGLAFLQGERWGTWEGDLAVALLKDEGVLLLDVDGEQVTGQRQLEALDDTYGRLRSLTVDADGNLWVTTSNGDDDKLLKVTPGS